MIKNNDKLLLNCMLIEALVASLVMRGETDNKKLVEAVDMQFHPNNEWEMEMYSEAIIYARHAVLN